MSFPSFSVIPAQAGILKVKKEHEQYYVYILASKKEGVLYTGVTHDLVRRVGEHKQGMVEGFTKKYFVKKLVYYEIYEDSIEAIKREKNIKKWNREWKTRLIEKNNAEWNDLYKTLI